MAKTTQTQKTRKIEPVPRVAKIVEAWAWLKGYAVTYEMYTIGKERLVRRIANGISGEAYYIEEDLPQDIAQEIAKMLMNLQMSQDVKVYVRPSLVAEGEHTKIFAVDVGEGWAYMFIVRKADKSVRFLSGLFKHARMLIEDVDLSPEEKEEAVAFISAIR